MENKVTLPKLGSDPSYEAGFADVWSAAASEILSITAVVGLAQAGSVVIELLDNSAAGIGSTHQCPAVIDQWDIRIGTVLDHGKLVNAALVIVTPHKTAAVAGGFTQETYSIIKELIQNYHFLGDGG